MHDVGRACDRLLWNSKKETSNNGSRELLFGGLIDGSNESHKLTLHVCGARLSINAASYRARASLSSITLLGSPRDTMRQWRKRNLSELLYARAGLEFVCLSIHKHAWYYPVVWHPLIHQTVLLSRHHTLKTVTLELSCALEYE